MRHEKTWMMLAAAIFLNACDDNSSESCTESVCSGDVARFCYLGSVVEKKCPFGCLDGACNKAGQICTNGAQKCSASGVPMICSENKWVEQAACGDDESCSRGVCAKKKAPDVVCTAGDKRCSSDGVPQKCFDNHWEYQAPCDDGLTCVNGACQVIPCGDSSCRSDESCVNFVCVPKWQLTVRDGYQCDPETWVEYCNDKNQSVACATKTGVYRVQCNEARPCKVGDFTDFNSGKPWFPAFCNSELVDSCYDTIDEIPYCASQKTNTGVEYYEASFVCAHALGGGFLALDYGEYGWAEKCEVNQCDNSGTVCYSGTPCSGLVDHCDGETLISCNNGKKDSMNCTEYDAVCRKFSFAQGFYVNCFDETDECTTLNAKKTKCDTINGKATTTTFTCLQADGDNSGKLYWAKTSDFHCAKACNSAKTGCAN